MSTPRLSSSQIESVQGIAHRAGRQIMSVYDSDDFDIEAKGDGSPLTRADRLAHETIVTGLQELTPDIPILSEESEGVDYEMRKGWTTLWLVDPLDGTKEFIKRNGEFTVNIALIEDHVPTFGVVFAPVLHRTYVGGTDYGATLTDADGNQNPLSATAFSSGKATVVASRSHRGEAVDAFIAALTKKEETPDVSSMGSSLKICLVADGTADVYPRLGPTCEWDTAAAHAVVLGAGGIVTDTSGSPLRYNKQDILNPWFLVSGSGGYDWPSLCTTKSADG